MEKKKCFNNGYKEIQIIMKPEYIIHIEPEWTGKKQLKIKEKTNLQTKLRE